MTGISDVVRSARSYSRLILTQRWIRQVLSHLPGFPNAFMVEDVPNLDSMPTSKLTYFREASDAYMEGSEARSIAPSTTHAASSITSPYKWGLILPVCCRSSDGAETCFGMLEDFVASVFSAGRKRGAPPLIARQRELPSYTTTPNRVIL